VSNGYGTAFELRVSAIRTGFDEQGAGSFLEVSLIL
jgi:hypothetical protein